MSFSLIEQFFEGTEYLIQLKLKTIGLLRHNQVELPFLKGMVTQAEVLEWFRKYETCEVKDGNFKIDQDWEICYTSTLKRAKDTATAISSAPMLHTELLNEPFPDPLFKSGIRLPFLVWGLLFKFAILCDHSSQSQSKKYLVKNLNELLLQIEKQPHSKILMVSHSFSIRTLSRLLVSRGFTGKQVSNPAHDKIYLFRKAL